jgi:hypothetical protein
LYLNRKPSPDTPCFSFLSFCYDTELEKWCTLKKIDVSSGGVYVVYEGDKEKLLISPDGLVGVDSNLSRQQYRLSQTTEDNTTQKQSDCISTLSSPVNRSIDDDDDDDFASISTHEDGDGPSVSTILREEGSINDQSSESSETGNSFCQDSGLRANSGPCGENATLQVGHENDSLLPCDSAVLLSDPSDEGETRNTDDTAPHPPHAWRPNAEDEYVKPRRNQVVSYLWDKPDIYRTGVLRSRDIIVFFEEPEADDGEPNVFTGSFELSKKWFKEGFFRTRLDLVPSR